MRIAVLGAGAWGTTIARVLAQNAASHDDMFYGTVDLYVEPIASDVNLAKTINSAHENPRYLPGIPLPDNVHASSDLLSVVSRAAILVFVCPHQFLGTLLDRIAAHVRRDAIAISLIKGLHAHDARMRTMSGMIRDALRIDCSALSGANVADQVAREQFSEATIGCRNVAHAAVFQAMFQRPYFRVQATTDIDGLEACGALKNIVALAAGFVDGLDLGTNTKAAVVRIGMEETMRLARVLFGDHVCDRTMLLSCGVADMITTCFSGRNRRVAEQFVRTGTPFDRLEAEMLHGQKLQGTLSAAEVHDVIVARGLTARFPLFAQTYRICFQGAPPRSIVDVLVQQPHEVVVAHHPDAA
ncbi:hypothetical protein PBRA_005202 [Plasmodiophora brassicae]|nr:hypothetical protein PBRA_005202 [Plasmodiophora brassicae]